MKMDKLPDEIIEIIFTKCCGSLKNLTLVCKRFCQLIGNSEKLMDNFKVKITKEKLQIENNAISNESEIMKSGRKYTNILCEGAEFNMNADLILKFIRNHQFTLHTIEFDCFDIKSSELMEMLQMVKDNLRSLNMTWVNLERDIEIEKIDFRKLEVLKIPGANESHYVLQLFEDANIKVVFVH
jgi:F-box-like